MVSSVFGVKSELRLLMLKEKVYNINVCSNICLLNCASNETLENQENHATSLFFLHVLTKKHL